MGRQAPLGISELKDLINANTAPLFSRSAILWVDDHPENNRFETQAFRELGIKVTAVSSTTDALATLSLSFKYDVIISDVQRDGDREDAFTLTRELGDRGFTQPVFIYTGMGPAVMAFAKGPRPTASPSLVLIHTNS